MGYMHISNLYKDNTIQMFRECYALEKVHGTSAHVAYKNTPTEPDKLVFFSGGEKRETFLKIFDEAKLLETFRVRGYTDITLYGEASGARCRPPQGRTPARTDNGGPPSLDSGHGRRCVS